MEDDAESVIRQSQSNQFDTVSTGPRSDKEAAMTAETLSPGWHKPAPYAGLPPAADTQYLAAMTTNAASVATAIRDELRDRITFLPDRKLQALLYLAQGVHFAANDKPLYDDDIIVTDQGVRLALVATHQTPLDDTQSAAVLLTAARYGGLSTMDLEALIRGQGPWARARDAGEHLISQEAIRVFFRAQDEIPEGTVLGFPRSSRRQGRSSGEPTNPLTPDSPEEIAAFIADAKARM